jgi:transposase
MFDELGLGEVSDHATHQHPAMRDLPVGEAVKAMVLNGLGFVNHALSLVPRFFQNQPTQQLVSFRVAPEQRNDEARGRAWETLYASGVTALYRLIAATAAKRLGRCPTSTPLATTSFPVDGHSNSDKEPEAQVVRIPKGSSRAHRPALHHVMLALLVEQQAGSPLLMKPLRGNRSAPQAFGQVIRAHSAPWQTTYGTPSLVADSAL